MQTQNPFADEFSKLTTAAIGLGQADGGGGELGELVGEGVLGLHRPGGEKGRGRYMVIQSRMRRAFAFPGARPA